MNLKQLILDNPYKFIALVVIFILLAYFFGCDAMVRSVLDPPKKVTKDELKAELDLFISQFDTKFKSIERQEAFREALFNSAVLMYQTGQVDPIGVAVTLAGILGIGSTADTVRLRKQIKNGKKTPPSVDHPVTPPT